LQRMMGAPYLPGFGRYGAPIIRSGRERGKSVRNPG
jgi:hypothetical protein